MYEVVIVSGAGFNLLLFGRGTFFIFLTILVFATRSMSSLIQRFLPEEPAIERKPNIAPVTNSTPVEPHVLAVIQAAVSAHRAKQAQCGFARKCPALSKINRSLTKVESLF